MCCRLLCCYYLVVVFFFKQKTAYEMRISDWSSDVCSSDLRGRYRSMFKILRMRNQKKLRAYVVGNYSDIGCCFGGNAQAWRKMPKAHDCSYGRWLVRSHAFPFPAPRKASKNRSEEPRLNSSH